MKKNKKKDVYVVVAIISNSDAVINDYKTKGYKLIGFDDSIAIFRKV